MFGTYRTFLALMVVGTHLAGIPRLGAYAVFGFYCLSGYLMTLIMQKNYGYSPAGITRYAVNRFLRIYPIYWFSIILSGVLIWFLGSDFTSKYHVAIYFPDGISEFIKNLTLFFPFREYPRLTPPAWALTVEVFYYILIAAGLSKNKLITTIWFFISVLYHVAGLAINFEWTHRYFTIPAASLPFSTGALIYNYRHIYIGFTNRLPGRIHGYFPYIICWLVLVNWAMGLLLSQSKGLFFYSNYILCASMVIILSDRTELTFISKSFDKWMGDFSYPIYLFHYQVGLVVVVIYKAAGIVINRPDLILMFTSIPLIFLCSWLITIIFERPIELVRLTIRS